MLYLNLCLSYLHHNGVENNAIAFSCFSGLYKGLFTFGSNHSVLCTSVSYVKLRGLTIKFANSPPCACRGSSGQKPQYGLMTLVYQRFTAVLLLICGILFLSGIYYCLSAFWCAITRMSELELEQRMNIKFLVKLGKSESEIRDMLVQVYGDNAMKKTAVYKG
jgi:hypothetical protein